MEIRPLEREKMVFENGAYGQRLLPWAALNAPFEGAWVTVPAHGATGAHSHHEYEIFIAVSGEAVVESGESAAPSGPATSSSTSPAPSTASSTTVPGTSRCTRSGGTPT